MSAFDGILDPDLEGVLHDLAKRGSSTLLAVRPDQIARSLYGGWEALSAGSPGLNSVERHLLEVHRDEMAWLLREAYVRGFYADEERAWQVRYGGTLAPTTDLEDALDGLDAVSHRDPDAARCVQLIRGGAPGLALLEASMRFESADNTLVFMANDHVAHGKMRVAEAVARRVIERRPSALHLALARHARGVALSSLELAEDAARELMQAERLLGRCTVAGLGVELPLCVQLTVSMQLGQVEQLERAARAIGELDETADPMIRDTSAKWRSMPGGTAEQSVRIARREIMAVQDRIDPISAELIDALLY